MPGLSPTMTAGRATLTARQGSTFEKTINVTRDNAPVDLTGVTARLQVRAHFADEAYSNEQPLLTLTTENGGIVIDPLLGTIRLIISASVTDAIKWKRGLFELKATGGGITVTLLEGEFRIKPAIVR